MNETVDGKNLKPGEPLYGVSHPHTHEPGYVFQIPTRSTTEIERGCLRHMVNSRDEHRPINELYSSKKAAENAYIEMVQEQYYFWRKELRRARTEGIAESIEGG